MCWGNVNFLESIGSSGTQALALHLISEWIRLLSPQSPIKPLMSLCVNCWLKQARGLITAGQSCPSGPSLFHSVIVFISISCMNNVFPGSVKRNYRGEKGRRREEEEREKRESVLRVRSIRSIGDLVAALSRVPSIREAGVLGNL